MELLREVLPDIHDGNLGRIDRGDAEEVAQLEVIDRPRIFRDEVDVQLDSLKLATVHQRQDGIAKTALFGFGLQPSRLGRFECKIVVKVKIDCLLEESAEGIGRPPPRCVGILRGAGVWTKARKQHLPALQCPGSVRRSPNEPGQQTLVRDLLAETIQGRTGFARGLSQTRLDRDPERRSVLVGAPTHAAKPSCVSTP